MKETIKKVLDHDCFDKSRDDCLLNRTNKKNTIYDCWQCHKNDLLAQKISDEIEFAKVGK
jgi:hypothetical protein